VYDVTIIGSDPNIIKKKIKDVKKSKKGHLVLCDLGTLRTAIRAQAAASSDWWNIISKIVKTLKDEANVTCCVLDSINSLYVLSNFKQPRNQIFYIFNYFKQLDITTFFISEMPKDAHKFSEYEIEDYLADGVIVIQLTERNRKVTREITIIKLRSTKINTDIFTLEYTPKGFQAIYGGKMPLV